MSYIYVVDVRTAGGFPSDLITDTQINHAIDIVSGFVEREMNCFISPRTIIETHSGRGIELFYTDRTPVLRIDKLVFKDDDIDVNHLDISRESGRVLTTSDSSIKRFFVGVNNIKVQYVSGWLIPDNNDKITLSAVNVGDTDIELDNVTDLVVGDWVQFYNIEGVYTCAKITDITGTTISVDSIVRDLDIGSRLTKLIIPNYIKRLIELECVLYLALNAIGATYVFNASYSLGDLNVTKGVPYTHWRESVEKAIKERDTLKKIIKPRIKIM